MEWKTSVKGTGNCRSAAGFSMVKNSCGSYPGALKEMAGKRKYQEMTEDTKGYSCSELPQGIACDNL